MSPIEIALRLVGGVFLVAGNAFFVVTEFAVTRLPQLDPDDDPPGMDAARRITDRLEIYLTGCQLGITSTSIVLGVVAEPAVTYLLTPLFALVGISGAPAHTISVVVGLVIINLIHKIWGEQVPTYLGVERPRQIAQRTARALEVWTTVVYPLIMFGDGLAKWTLGLFGMEMERSWTEGEEGEEEEFLVGPSAVRREIGNVLSRANLSRERSYEIMRAVEIENIPVRRITVPRSEMVALRATDELSESLQRMRAHPYDRYPLFGDDKTGIVGILYMTNVFRHLPELERGEAHLADIAEPAVWVDPDLPISDLIDRFQSEKQELAIVRDDRIHGLVTATDAFEAITGELEDPEDVDRREAANQTATSSAQPASTTGRSGEE